MDLGRSSPRTTRSIPADSAATRGLATPTPRVNANDPEDFRRDGRTPGRSVYDRRVADAARDRTGPGRVRPRPGRHVRSGPRHRGLRARQEELLQVRRRAPTALGGPGLAQSAL